MLIFILWLCKILSLKFDFESSHVTDAKSRKDILQQRTCGPGLSLLLREKHWQTHTQTHIKHDWPRQCGQIILLN